MILTPVSVICMGCQNVFSLVYLFVCLFVCFCLRFFLLQFILCEHFLFSNKLILLYLFFRINVFRCTVRPTYSFLFNI